jgi:thioredoxin 1
MDRVFVIRIAAGLLIGCALGALLGFVGKCSTGTCPLTANPWRGAFFGGLLGILFSFSMAPAGTCPPTMTAASETESEKGQANQALVHVTSLEQFDREVLSSEIPVLADLYSDSCPPCRALGPIVEGLARKYQGKSVVAKINVDRLPQLAERYGISAIPAVLFFSEGKEVERMIGLQGEWAYAQVLDKLVDRFQSGF